MSTLYHCKYWASALMLQKVGGELESLSRAIAAARVDLNPHQIDAALFAIRSPFSKGVMLADEVGLGKTIEAGIVIAQRWAERRRKMLLIVPATLRKQWQQELEEKFSIPVLILESKSFNQSVKAGLLNPFEQSHRLIICSYNFAAAKAREIKQIGWDLAVLDEAHRLRNIYKSSHHTGSQIASAIADVPKILLTATPLQNSLLELYGLVSVIDPHVFGDVGSFREQFVRTNDEMLRNQELKIRLEPICKRTLRRQVLEYIRFTQRIPLTQEFLPTDAEHQLYEEVSAYLQQDVLLALPASQRSLMTLVLRKLLASSTFAIAETLKRLVQRLETMQQGDRKELVSEEDFEAIAELEDEWNEDGKAISEADQTLVKKELGVLRQYVELAEGIQYNAKGQALLSVLSESLDQAERLGALRKAIIFTESRRTQQYLFGLLSTNGYANQIVLMNGSNTDPHSRAIYQRWLDRRTARSEVSSRAAEIKAALVDEFRQ